jgi:sugar/nucleoside kinase (ribokinase family)
MRALRALGPRIVVTTLGARGCAYLDGEDEVRVPAYEVEVLDTTGAGDAFHGAYLYGLLRNWSPRERARFANAVAALNCTALGGRAGLPDLRRARALMDRG